MNSNQLTCTIELIEMYMKPGGNFFGVVTLEDFFALKQTICKSSEHFLELDQTPTVLINFKNRSSFSLASYAATGYKKGQGVKRCLQNNFKKCNQDNPFPVFSDVIGFNSPSFTDDLSSKMSSNQKSVSFCMDIIKRCVVYEITSIFAVN